MRTLSSSAALALALTIALPAFAQKGPPDEAKVDAAIKKGVKYLKSSNTYKDDGDRTSERELVLLTLRHAGISENDPSFVQPLQWRCHEACA